MVRQELQLLHEERHPSTHNNRSRSQGRIAKHERAQTEGAKTDEGAGERPAQESGFRSDTRQDDPCRSRQRKLLSPSRHAESMPPA